MFFNISSDGYGEVIQQTYGIWHTKCFPRPTPPTDAEVQNICQQIGYYDATRARGRIIDENDEKFRSKSSQLEVATKAVVTNQIAPLKLNENLTIYLKSSKPNAELANWDAADKLKCYRLEISCE